MKRMNIILLLFVVLSITNACNNKENKDCHKSIEIINNSSKSIYVIGDVQYPDTTYFIHSASPELTSYITKVTSETSSSKPLRFTWDCWETIFSYGAQIPSDTVMIFIFDAETIENTSWSIVCGDYLVLQRYDLSLENLKYLNWKLSYPPTEEMKDMKMYPPYKK